MRCLRWILFTSLATVYAFAADSWRPLFNGRDLSNWDMFLTTPDASWDVPGVPRDAKGKYLEPIGLNHDPLHVFTVEKANGVPVIHVSGQGFGVITSREVFGNVHVRVQVKWGEKKWGSKINAPRDCGLLYYCHGTPGFDHATWPRSIEFQIQEHDMGDVYALGSQITVNARQEGRLYYYDPQKEPVIFAQKPPVGNRCIKAGDPEKPNGEWNQLDLYCHDGKSIHVVNGQVVMRLTGATRLDGAAPAPLTSGQVSLQTEGAEVYYRAVEVCPLADFPADLLQPL